MSTIGDRQLLWVDLDHRELADLTPFAEGLGLPTGEIERVVSDQRHAALSRVGDRLHLTLEALEGDDETPTELVRHEIDLIVGPNVVITIHEGPIQALARCSERVDAGETRIGALDAVDLMSSLTDAVFAEYFETVERIQREIDELDERALRGRPGDDVLRAIVDVRRRVGLVRRTLAPHREVMAALARPEMRAHEESDPGAGRRLAVLGAR
ncbi:MAG: CorA family divalent cation transporter [Candidatus Limnocylindrales bacterium]|nr:hypothetical protein [Chloroflexota bacterium]